MIIKNAQLTNDTISALNTLIELDIKAGVAFKLTRIIKELSSIVEDKLKMEKKILDKWVERDEEGKPVIPKGQDGKPIEGPGRDRGMVFQGYTLFPWRTVKQNVMFGLEMNGMGVNQAGPEAELWLELVGLEKFANAYPHELSGGMKQRVAIARALVNQPRILLMDEPFGALDAQTRSKMQAHLLEIWRNIDITVVFITHDLDEAIFLADRILVLKAHPGEVMELIEVPVPRPRHLTQTNSAEFLATKARLEALIHPHEEQDSTEEPIQQRMIRFVNVADNVE